MTINDKPTIYDAIGELAMEVAQLKERECMNSGAIWLSQIMKDYRHLFEPPKAGEPITKP